jgi:hypothetical protein
MAQSQYDQLLKLLRNPQIPGQQLSQAIVDRGRAYQGAADATLGRFARGGLENAGVAGAAATSYKLNAAKDADILRRKMAADNEARRRQLIQLYTQTVLSPQMTASQAAVRNQLNLNQEAFDNSNQRLDQWGQMAGALGGIAGAFQTPKTGV